MEDITLLSRLKDLKHNLFGRENLKNSPAKFILFQKTIDYWFNDLELLKRALSHRSFINAKNKDSILSNERQEFLGDSVLNFVVAEHLYRTFPHFNEGKLTQIRALWVSKAMLIYSCELIDLGYFLFLSESEAKSGGRKRKSILCDTYEAVVAAIYLDGGLEKAREFIKITLLDHAMVWSEKHDFNNYKSLLLEYVQSKKMGNLSYQVLSEKGPEHNKMFEVAAVVDGEMLGIGHGKNKKSAEQKAAKEACKSLNLSIF